MKKEIGIFVRDELRKKILNKNIILKTIKDKKGKYGRYLGIIYVLNEDEIEDKNEDKYLCINDWLLEMNYAVVYK